MIYKDDVFLNNNKTLMESVKNIYLFLYDVSISTMEIFSGTKNIRKQKLTTFKKVVQ